MKHLDISPISNAALKPYLDCNDYTVSNKKFSILIDKDSEFLVTSPRPNDEDLAQYYESEDYISHSNAKKTLLDKVYQLVRNYTIKQKIKLIDSFDLETRSILDIGAGTGDFLEACKNNHWKVEGVEPNSNAKSLAEEKLKINLKNTIDELGSQKYDVITMWHVLEHVPNLLEYVSSLKQILKHNGVLIVAVPNYKSYDARHYKEFWAAYDVPRHLWHFSKSAIKKLFVKEQMVVDQILPMKFDAFYVSLLSEKYKTGKLNPLQAFYRGLQSNIKANKTKEYSSLIYIIKNA